MLEIRNGYIENVCIGYTDRGILGLSISLKFGLCAVYGGFALDGKPCKDWLQGKERSPSGYCGAVIQVLLHTFEKDMLHDLRNIPCRVKILDNLVVGIGNFMDEKWFSFKDIAEEYSILNKE